MIGGRPSRDDCFDTAIEIPGANSERDVGQQYRYLAHGFDNQRLYWIFLVARSRSNEQYGVADAATRTLGMCEDRNAQ